MGGANSFSTSDVPSGIDERLTRKWLVAETGEVGSVDLSFDLTGVTLLSGDALSFKFYLLTDADGTFASGATALQASSFSNSIVTFTGINEDVLDDGTFFTLGAKKLVGPAGIAAGIHLWYRADAGTSTTTDGSTLTTWSDQSGNGIDATESSNPPLFKNNTTDNINFNPTIDFDGTDDQMITSLDALEGGADYSFFAVSIREANNAQPILSHDFSEESFIFGYSSDNYFFHIHPTEAITGASNFGHSSPGLTPSLLIGINDLPKEKRNGTTAEQNSKNNDALADAATYYLGRYITTHFNGRISEVIVYDTNLSASEENRVSSYLAIKYGISLGQNLAAQDYLDSGGNVIWDASVVGTTYDEDITAIGQDDASGLDQTQSKNGNIDAIVTIAENGGGMADGELLFWSNDGGANSFSSTDVPLGIDERLTRRWLVAETGEVGSVDLSFDLTGVTLPSGVALASEFFLLTDADGTFASGATALHASSFSNSIVTFTGVSEDLLDDGVFYTLGVAANGDPDAVDDTVQRVPGTDLVKIFIQDLLDNDSDPDGDSFSFVADQLPATSTNGSTLAVLTGDRWILYTPAESDPGTDDTFTYQIQDSHSATATATVTITTETSNTQTRNNTRAAINGSDIDVEFRGIPGRTYKVQYATSLVEPITWIDTSLTITAGTRGRIFHRDLNAAGQHGSKFFRTVEVEE